VILSLHFQRIQFKVKLLFSFCKLFEKRVNFFVSEGLLLLFISPSLANLKCPRKATTAHKLSTQTVNKTIYTCGGRAGVAQVLFVLYLICSVCCQVKSKPQGKKKNEKKSNRKER